MNYSINDWLKKIWEAISALSNSIKNAYQSDWNENDSTAASFIKNKPEIPTMPTVPTVGTIVDGTVSEGNFTPGSDAADFSEVLALIAETPSVVYLAYSGTYDMVVTASESLIKAASGVVWEAPSDSEEETES